MKGGNILRKASVMFFSSFVVIFFGCSKPQNSGKTLAPGILKIGIEYGYPPFEYLLEDGVTLAGFDVDMAEELCRRLELQPQYIDTQWAGIFEGLAAQRYDCIISAVTITPQRQERFLVTEPYVWNSQCFIVRQDFLEVIDSPEKLAGLKVAYQEETVSDVFVTECLKKYNNFSVLEYDKLLDAFEDLKNFRCDVVVAESVAAEKIVRDANGLLRKDWMGPKEASFGILVNKTNQDLYDEIVKNLCLMREDGFMKKLEEKYFN